MSAEFYMGFFMHATTPMVIAQYKSDKFSLVTWNQRAAALLGEESCEQGAVPPLAFGLPHTSRDASELRQRIIAEKSVERLWICKACGDRAWSLITTMLVLDDETYFLTEYVERSGVFSQVKDHLEESEERYRSLVENSPYPIVVYDEKSFLFVNGAAARLAGVDNPDELLGISPYSLIHTQDKGKAATRFRKMVFKEQNVPVTEQRFVRKDGTALYAEVMESGIIFKGKRVVQAIIRDLTEEKAELQKAVQLKRQLSFRQESVLAGRAEMLMVDRPKDLVGGDLFHLTPIKPGVVVGLLGDVAGKGIVAALSNSAVSYIYNEIVNQTDEPSEILHKMNCAISQHMPDEYVAALCFRINFNNGRLKVAGAGLNNFDCYLRGVFAGGVVRGPFLGMVKDPQYDVAEIAISTSDVLFFYSDGLEAIYKSFGSNRPTPNPASLMNFIDKQLDQCQEDDCTWVALSMLDVGKASQRGWSYVQRFYGISGYSLILDSFLDEFRLMPEFYNSLMLALTEAVANAFLHGNGGDVRKPITLRKMVRSRQVIFQVEDCGDGFVPANRTSIAGTEMENGRGMFLIDQHVDEMNVRGGVLELRKDLPTYKGVLGCV